MCKKTAFALWLLSSAICHASPTLAQVPNSDIKTVQSAPAVNAAELGAQLAEVAAIPDFEITREKIEEITHISFKRDNSPARGAQQPDASRWIFEPTTDHPYRIYLELSPKRTRFAFAWRDPANPDWSFVNAPAGMCIQPDLLKSGLLESKWKLKHHIQYRDADPGDVYLRGEYGLLQLSFDGRTQCLNLFSLTASLVRLD
jgi:hypothetical protein